MLPEPFEPGPYDRRVPPLLVLVALLGVVTLLLLIPTRRLYLAGWSQRALIVYLVVMLGLAILVAELRGPARFLVPILIIGYIAPFVVAGDAVARLLGRQPRRPVVKDVTPPPTLIEGTARRVDETPERRGDAIEGEPADRPEAVAKGGETRRPENGARDTEGQPQEGEARAEEAEHPGDGP